MLPQPKDSTASPIYPFLLIGLLLLATPFLLFPSGYKVLALLLLPAIWVIRWVVVGSVTPRTPLDWPILLILIMVLVSIWATFDLSFSIGKIAGLLLGIAVYYAIADLAHSESSLQAVTVIFILSGLGLVAISIVVGIDWLYKSPLIIPLLSRFPTNLHGIPGAEQGFDTNQLGGVLLLFIPLQLALLGFWLRKVLSWPLPAEGNIETKDPAAENAAKELAAFQAGKRRKLREALGVIAMGGSIAITTGMLLLTQSRGAWGGLVVGLVTIAAIRTRWGKLLAVIGLAAILVVIQAGLVDELLSPSGLETEVAGTVRLGFRLEVWSRALQGLADFPFTGMGMNTFRRVMPVLYPAFSIPPDYDIAHAHNHLLQTGLDLGIPGLVAYLALWLGAGFMLTQIISKARSEFYRAAAVGLVGSFTAYFVYGITDTVALGAKPGFIFWWALGLVVATHRLFYQDRLTA